MSKSFLRLCMGPLSSRRKTNERPTVGHRRLRAGKPAGRPIVKLGSQLLLTPLFPGSSGNCRGACCKDFFTECMGLMREVRSRCVEGSCSKPRTHDRGLSGHVDVSGFHGNV